MKKTKIFGWAMVLSLALGLSWLGVSHAQTFRSTVDKNTTINSSLYSTGKKVVVQGTINGDVFCAAQEVIINATVHGDVICAGQEVTIGGQVYGDIRAAAQTMTITAQVTHNATLLGRDVRVTPEAKINQDLTTASGTLRLQGIVGRDLIANGTKALLSNEVGRNVTFHGTDLSLLRGAQVGGDLSYTSPQAASIASTAEVAGDTKHHQPPQHKPNTFLGVNKLSWVLALMLILFSLVLVLLFPQRMHQLAGEATNHLGKSILVGLLASGLFPIAAVIAMITVVGIPIGVFLLLVWFLLMMLSGPITAYYLGSMILSKSKNPIAILLGGAVILALLYVLPVVGAIFIFVGYWIGSGAILLWLKHHSSKPLYKVK